MADDIAFEVHNHQDAQEIITRFSESAKAFGLKIDHKKTEVMYDPFPGFHDIGQDMQIEDQVQTQLNKFKYLDSNNTLDAELDTQPSNT